MTKHTNTWNLRQAHIDWINSSSANVYATLKFRNGFDIGEQQAQRVLQIFLNKLDRTYYTKQQLRQGKRVERFVYLHKGRSQQNTHYHVAFTAVGLVPTFCSIAHSIWSRSFTETCAATTQITAIKSRKGTSIYSLHEYGTLGERTFIDTLSHAEQAADTGIEKNIRLVRRLLKATEDTE
ncbi:hypothetical protein [Phaeovulum veldkampii]|jgi:hypothetical protein|uniref:hypothetical protein n=1 Tax=Phaeovulum veldkampii TaxID=33049 RepID=UPI00105C71DD|nr:hypothetical protein [Phaeovulum veldkampii]